MSSVASLWLILATHHNCSPIPVHNNNLSNVIMRVYLSNFSEMRCFNFCVSLVLLLIWICMLLVIYQSINLCTIHANSHKFE